MGGSGTLSRTELDEILSDDKVKAYLAAIEIEVFEVASIFQLLDDGDGTISYEEFLHGIMRLKGTARSQDVIAILHTLKGVRKEIASLNDNITYTPKSVAFDTG